MNNSKLRSHPNIHKCLISSPARFNGDYENDELLIAPAHPSMRNQALKNTQRENEYNESQISIYYYVCTFNFLPEPDQQIVIPDNSYIGDSISIALAVYYGKRFDNHGILESYGIFWMPNYEPIFSIYNYYFGINNHFPRKDLEIPLTFDKCEAIIKFILTRNAQYEKLHRYFLAAGKFYLNSLQIMDQDIEKAYLDLITCGEILSNFYEYTDNELYDEETKQIFIRLACVAQESDIKHLKSGSYKVRKKFSLTLKSLLNKKFFSKTESTDESMKLKEECIEINIKAAHDIRSKYLHTGQIFKPYIEQMYQSINEVGIPEPNVDDKDLKKVLKRIPTYIGLERIIRFALLRFLHTNGVYIHKDLDDDSELIN
ncbi:MULTISPECIES: hypothetical protein [unclassified Nostoc]|uniref:hypothetical protein n=1 Tax=unclassified Nostoc TaxID=2593658 RepID=UPI00114CE29B|nr:hypothetical protein [Nostoc sp. KVJ20]